MKTPTKYLPVQTVPQAHIPSVVDVAADNTPPTTAAMPSILVGVAAIAIFVIGVIAWCIYVPMTRSISAQGELVFQGKRQAVQHLEGGIIGKILVKDGDLVQSGQPLIELERKQVQPLVRMLEEQSAAEAAFSARLEAESRDLPRVNYPGEASSKAAQTENRLFETRRVAFNHQLELTRLQITQIKESIKGAKERLAAKKTEIGILRDQLNANQSLQAAGYIPRNVILDQQRQLASMLGEQESITASLASEEQRIHELEQRIISLKSDRIQGAVSEQKQSIQRRIDLQERIRPVKDTLDRQIIRAPVAGKVVGLKVATIGGVLNPRETIMEIAPTDVQLIVEAKVKGEDINDVKVGQKADVTITGLDPQKIPYLKANVSYISADRTPTPQTTQIPQTYYAISVVLDSEYMKKFPEINLVPGMTANVSIAAKPRSALNLMMEPIIKHVKKAVNSH